MYLTDALYHVLKKWQKVLGYTNYVELRETNAEIRGKAPFHVS